MSDADLVLVHFRPVDHAGIMAATGENQFDATVLCRLYCIHQEIHVVCGQQMPLVVFDIAADMATFLFPWNRCMVNVGVPVPAQASS